MIPEERVVGEIRYTYLDMTADLKDGQSVTSVTWGIETGSGITFVNGTNTVTNNTAGVAAIVQGKFDYSAATPSDSELYTLAATVVCTTPSETKIGTVQVHVSDVP